MQELNIKNLFYDLQEQMTAKLHTNRNNIHHPGTKGDACELNWIEWLKTYLPKRYSVDKAIIIDCENNISDQIDIVIYDQQYSPFVFNQDSAIYIPAESVYAVFEVKQELNHEYIKYASEKADSVKKLKRTSAIIPHAGGCYDAKSPSKIISGILTLTSGWNPPLGESFEKSIFEYQSLDLGCVLNEGAFHINYIDGKTIINKSVKEEALIFFFLKLLDELRKLGTVPAMDIGCYAKELKSKF